MPNKNDISAFKKSVTQSQETAKPFLVETEEKIETRGRKPKPADEKETEMIAIKVKKSEKEALLAKAGLVPMGTFLKHYLRKDTDIFG